MGILDYRTVVLKLLEKSQYPVLLDFVIFSIWYKMAVPMELPKVVSATCRSLQDVYNEYNSAFEYIMIDKHNNNFQVHVENDVNLKNVPENCIRVKIERGYINQQLETHYTSFEEEIYKFITLLNFNPRLLSKMIDIPTDKCTQFCPTKLTMHVSDFEKRPVDKGCALPTYFGPNCTYIFQPRLYDGKLSTSSSSHTLLSLHNAIAWRDTPDLPEMTSRYENYTMYYAERDKSYIPLAFNPLENPIIV